MTAELFGQRRQFLDAEQENFFQNLGKLQTPSAVDTQQKARSKRAFWFRQDEPYSASPTGRQLQNRLRSP